MTAEVTSCPGCGRRFKNLQRHLAYPGIPCSQPKDGTRPLEDVLEALPERLILAVPGRPLATVHQWLILLATSPEGRELLKKPARSWLERRRHQRYQLYTGSIQLEEDLTRAWADVPAQLL